jgi:DNA-binding transcriptional MerR regulator
MTATMSALTVGATAGPDDGLRIADVVAVTGLSRDTLRWYEKKGLLPLVARGGDGRRRYHARNVALLQVLVRLRRTGMPVEQVRRFSQLMDGGAATHGVRMALLLDHRAAVLRHIDALHTDLAALDDKIDHYRALINAGLDCDGTPVDAPTAALQRSTDPVPKDLR